MGAPPLLLLNDADVRELFTPAVALAAAESAFRAEGEGNASPPQAIGFHLPDGGLHVKAALHLGARPVFAAKVNGDFPGNPERFGLPTTQGAVVLADAEHGSPLALLASGRLTALRTAAATGVAVKHLAPPIATVAAIIGCGLQGKTHIPFLRRLLGLREIRLFDADPRRAASLAGEMREEVGVAFTPCATAAAASRGAQVVVTSTTSTVPFLTRDDVGPGTLIAAVGADSPQKWELAPSLMAAAAVVCDLTSQCAELGELHHAIAAKAMTAGQVRAQLGEVVAGKRPGRHTEEEVVIFDSTGTALLDVTAALGIYQAAVAAGRGTPFALT